MKRRTQTARKVSKPVPAVRPDALIDPKVLQELIDIFQTAGVADLEIEREGLRVRLRREETGTPPLPKEVSVHLPDAGRALQPVDAEPPLPTGGGLLTVTSPIVGVFYRSASPDIEAYVDVGSYVKKGQVLCIVEAMKLMNEIESEVDGRVVKILQENAKPVEFGEPLFLIESGSGSGM
jgi:acetyl-CoA carboxylase biotin carboxyl carrier protein